MAREVDARGLGCPQPLFLATKALSEESGPVTVTVDSASAAESLKRAAKREKSRSVEIIETKEGAVFKFGPRS
jgi:TusA-related sulfurtransferase